MATTPRTKIKYDQYFVRQNYGNDTWIWVTANARIPVAAWAMCQDGKRRIINNLKQPDSWFSQPGRTTIFDSHAYGYLTSGDNNQLEFRLFDREIERLNRRKPDQPWLYTRITISRREHPRDEQDQANDCCLERPEETVDHRGDTPQRLANTVRKA